MIHLALAIYFTSGARPLPLCPSWASNTPLVCVLDSYNSPSPTTIPQLDVDLPESELNPDLLVRPLWAQTRQSLAYKVWNLCSKCKIMKPLYTLNRLFMCVILFFQPSLSLNHITNFAIIPHHHIFVRYMHTYIWTCVHTCNNLIKNSPTP